jgi:RNA recognition motif-containing protein
LKEFFKSCGAVKRVTIPEDAQKKPKGFALLAILCSKILFSYAYLEFEEMEAVTYALVL